MNILLITLLYTFAFSDSYSIEIDASSYTDWIYYNFTLHSEVQVNDPKNSLGWDIAFQRNHIKTNSGTSGIGLGGAYVDSLNLWTADSFNNTNTVQQGSLFEIDTLIQSFYDLETHTMSWGSTNTNLETWGWFDYENNYTLVVTNNQFIIRSANGENFIKIWPYGYYNDVGNSGHISILYNDDVDCLYEMDFCGVCGGNNSTCSLFGDINQDNEVNLLDIYYIIQYLNNYSVDTNESISMDLNQDMNIDIFDIIILIELII